jgi:hypothetical protein
LFLGPNLVHELRKAEDLSDIRKKSFTAIKEFLARWLESHPTEEWMGRVSRVRSWSAPGRLVKLIHRMPPDAPREIRIHLMKWLKHDDHLWAYERNLADQAQRRRRETYRVWARELVEAHRDICIEKLDLRPLAQSEEEPQRFRKLVAPSLLRQILKAAAGTRFRERDLGRGTVVKLKQVSHASIPPASPPAEVSLEAFR